MNASLFAGLFCSGGSNICVHAAAMERIWSWGRKSISGLGPALGSHSSASHWVSVLCKSGQVLGKSLNLSSISESHPGVNLQKIVKRRGSTAGDIEFGRGGSSLPASGKGSSCGRHYAEDFCRSSTIPGTPLTCLLSLQSRIDLSGEQWQAQ